MFLIWLEKFTLELLSKLHKKNTSNILVQTNIISNRLLWKQNEKYATVTKTYERIIWVMKKKKLSLHSFTKRYEARKLQKTASGEFWKGNCHSPTNQSACMRSQKSHVHIMHESRLAWQATFNASRINLGLFSAAPSFYLWKGTRCSKKKLF